MLPYCNYCNSLTTAIQGNNFCSKRNNNMVSIGNNAFYLNSSNISSGEHLSRLTIRSVFNGYHYHKVNGYDHTVNPSNYLIVNEGQPYQSEIQAEKPLEALIVAFRSGFVEDVNYSLVAAEEKLLDDPFKNNHEPIHFFETTYPSDKEIQTALLHIKQVTLQGEKDPILLEQLFIATSTRMLQNHYKTLQKIYKLPSTKNSTKLEVYKRISRAKDFMDSHFADKLSLNRISREANLSSFHFLRSFKNHYGQTPYRYLISARINYACYLLKASAKSIGSIAQESGFDTHSAFSRVFKKFTGSRPEQYRQFLDR